MALAGCRRCGVFRRSADCAPRWDRRRTRTIGHWRVPTGPGPVPAGRAPRGGGVSRAEQGLGPWPLRVLLRDVRGARPAGRPARRRYHARSAPVDPCRLRPGISRRSSASYSRDRRRS